MKDILFKVWMFTWYLIGLAVTALATPMFITFLVLKLTETIAWSWVLVTAPLWAVPVVWIIALAAIFSVAMLVD